MSEKVVVRWPAPWQVEAAARGRVQLYQDNGTGRGTYRRLRLGAADLARYEKAKRDRVLVLDCERVILTRAWRLWCGAVGWPAVVVVDNGQLCAVTLTMPPGRALDPWRAAMALDLASERDGLGWLFVSPGLVEGRRVHRARVKQLVGELLTLASEGYALLGIWGWGQ